MLYSPSDSVAFPGCPSFDGATAILPCLRQRSSDNLQIFASTSYGQLYISGRLTSIATSSFFLL